MNSFKEILKFCKRNIRATIIHFILVYSFFVIALIFCTDVKESLSVILAIPFLISLVISIGCSICVGTYSVLLAPIFKRRQ